MKMGGAAFLAGSALTALLVTVGAAKLLVQRWPATGAFKQVVLAALSFPALTVLLAALATIVVLAQPRLPEPGGTTGMAVFAMLFIAFIACAIGAIVGVPTAIVAVRAFRGG